MRCCAHAMCVRTRDSDMCCSDGLGLGSAAEEFAFGRRSLQQSSTGFTLGAPLRCVVLCCLLINRRGDLKGDAALCAQCLRPDLPGVSTHGVLTGYSGYSLWLVRPPALLFVRSVFGPVCQGYSSTHGALLTRPAWLGVRPVVRPTLPPFRTQSARPLGSPPPPPLRGHSSALPTRARFCTMRCTAGTHRVLTGYSQGTQGTHTLAAALC